MTVPRNSALPCYRMEKCLLWAARPVGPGVQGSTRANLQSGLGHVHIRPELNFKRFKLAKAVVPLRDGRILIGGGADQPEIYDLASGA